MNSRIRLNNGVHVVSELNATTIGVDEVWLEEHPEFYIYSSDHVVDVFQSEPAHQFVGEYRVHEDTASGDWFIYPHNNPNQRVARGLTRLHVLGMLLLQLGGRS